MLQQFLDQLDQLDQLVLLVQLERQALAQMLYQYLYYWVECSRISQYENCSVYNCSQRREAR